MKLGIVAAVCVVLWSGASLGQDAEPVQLVGAAIEVMPQTQHPVPGCVLVVGIASVGVGITLLTKVMMLKPPEDEAAAIARALKVPKSVLMQARQRAQDKGIAVGGLLLAESAWK